MWIADPSANEVNSVRLAGGYNAPRQSIFVDPYDPSQEVGWFDSLAASFSRENVIATGVGKARNSTVATEDEINQAVREGFNPYSYLKETYSNEELQDVMPYILDGELEETFSARQVEAILSDLRTELDLQRRASANPSAAIIGGLAGAIADPTSYIPYVGVASKISRAGRMGIAAGNAALSAGVSELALQSMQRTRSLEETLMNIGTAGVIGGGVGFFAGAAYKKSTLHPTNPNNPLRRENLHANPEITRTLDGEIDELTPDELARLAEDSIGAARVEGTRERFTDDDTKIARSEPTTKVGEAVRKIGDFFNSKTIVGRAVRQESAEGRRMALALMDPGGTLLRGHLKGKALTPAAEDIKATYMVRAEALSASMRQSVVDLRVEMGKKIDEQDVYRLTQRMLYEMDDKALFDDLIKKYGQDGFNRMTEKAKANAEEIHKANDEFEALMVERGILQDDAKVSKLQAELEGLKAEVENLKAAGDEARLLRVRAMRDDVKKQLTEETSKAKAMGRDYGHAQLWNRDVIIENPDEFKAFLRDAMLDKPSAEWLAEPPYEMTPDEFLALRETNRAKYDAILEDWSGDAWYHQLTQAENTFNAAVKHQKAAELDLNDALRSARLLKREDGQATLSLARKLRDKINSDLEAARQSKAKAEADLRAYQEGQRAATRMAKRPLTIDLQSKPQAKQTGKEIGKVEELMAQVQRETKRMADLAARRDRVNEAFAKAEARKAQVKDAKAQMDDVLTTLKDRGRIADKDLRKAKSALRRAKTNTPLDKLIDEVYSNLTTVGRVPQGIIDRLTRESDRTTGRVKDRIIQLDKEQRMHGIQRGYLKDDLPQILYNQYDQVSAELALREALDIGPTGKWSSWNDRLSAVEQDYNDMIAEAAQAGNRKRADMLRKQRDVVLDDLVAARDRIRGNVMTADGTTHGWANWLSSKVRAVQFMRFGGGFLFTSLTDAATMSLRTGGFAKSLKQYGTTSARAALNLSRKEGIAQTDIEAFVASMELGIGAAAHARRFGSEDLVNGPYGSHGIGTGMTRKVTGGIDKGVGYVNEKVGLLSGLPLWNRTMKIMAGHMMSVRIRDSVGKFDQLSKVEMADLASVGIGRAEAKRLDKLIKQHGKTDKQGVFDPGLDKWPADDARTFLMAVHRDMNRAINTPGVGDTPRLMDTWWGKLWLQFQTFSFTFINRYAYPTTQRIALGDRKAIASTIYLLGASAMVVAFKDLLRGNDPTERYREGEYADTLYEILDRSGIMGWTSPYVDSALKLGGFGGLERYARQNALVTPFGVNAGFVSDINRAAVAAMDADPDVVDKMLVLAPMSTQLRLFNHLME